MKDHFRATRRGPLADRDAAVEQEELRSGPPMKNDQSETRPTERGGAKVGWLLRAIRYHLAVLNPGLELLSARTLFAREGDRFSSGPHAAIFSQRSLTSFCDRADDTKSTRLRTLEALLSPSKPTVESRCQSTEKAQMFHMTHGSLST